MFVHTENHGLINLNCFPQVDVVGYDGVWRLHAFDKKPPNAPTFSLPGFPLAEFKEEIEARYSFCRLYSALEAKLFVWDPLKVQQFSELWYKAKADLSSFNIPYLGLEDLNLLELEIVGLRKITISYRYGDIPEADKAKVEDKIQSVLKSADPMQHSLTVWKIDWKD